MKDEELRAVLRKQIAAQRLLAKTRPGNSGKRTYAPDPKPVGKKKQGKRK